MSESGIGETEGLTPLFPEGGDGDLTAVGAGEGAGFDYRKRCEKRRVFAD